MAAERYTVTVISVGDNGLTARPAVVDRLKGGVVKVYRRTEEHLAVRHAARLNAAARITEIQSKTAGVDVGDVDAEIRRMRDGGP